MPDGGSINVKITAEAAGFVSGVNQAQAALGQFQAAAQQTASGVNQASQSVNAAGNAISSSASKASGAASNLRSSAGSLRGVFHEAEEGAKSAGESIRGLWENIERGVAILGVGLGIREVINQLKELAEAAEHTENVAASLGIEVEEYSKFSGALQLVGLDADTARRSLISLQTKTVEAAEAPGKARSAMLSLGYSMADIKRSSEDAVFGINRISQAIAEYANSPTKETDLRELLNARGMEALIAAAKDGPQALEALKQKWIELSGQNKEAIEHLAETAKIINEVEAAFTGLKTAVYENFREPINSAIKTLKEFIVHLHDSPAAIQGLIDSLDHLAGAAAGFLAGGFVGGPIGAIGGAAIGAASGVSGITAAVKELQSESQQLYDGWHAFATWWDNVQEAWGHGRPSGTLRPPPDYTTKLPGGGASAPIPPKPLPNDQTTKLPGGGASAPIPPAGKTGSSEPFGPPAPAAAEKPPVLPQPNINKEKEELDLQKKLIEDKLKEQLAADAYDIAAAKGHADKIAAIHQRELQQQQQALDATTALIEKKKADFRALYGDKTDEETLAKIIGGYLTVNPTTGKKEATVDTTDLKVQQTKLLTEALKQQQQAREELIKAEMKEADVLASADQARLRIAKLRAEEQGEATGHAGKIEALQAEVQLTAQYAAQEIARYQQIADAAETSTDARIAAYDKIAHIAEQTAEKEEELAKQVAEAQKKAAEEAAKVFTDFFKGAESALDSFVEASIIGGKNRAQAFRDLYTSMVKDAVKTITNLGSQLAAQGLANLTGQKLEPGKGLGDLLGQMVGQLFGLGGGKDSTQLAAQQRANEFLGKIDSTLSRIEELTRQKTTEARAAVGGALAEGTGTGTGTGAAYAPATGPYADLINNAAAQYKIPPGILYNLIGAESSFNPNIGKSSAGAEGLAQFIPETAKEYGVDVNSPSSSIFGAAHYLSDLYAKKGSWAGALGAYSGQGPALGSYAGQKNPYGPALVAAANQADSGTGGGSPVDFALQAQGLGASHNPEAATSLLKQGGVDLDVKTQKWCAALVNAALEHAGLPGSGNALASSFKNYGQAVAPGNVQRGDIFYSGPNGQGDTGHVGFALGPVENGRVQVMSSHTQGDASNPAGVEYRDASNLSFRRPTQVASAAPEQKQAADKTSAAADKLDHAAEKLAGAPTGNSPYAAAVRADIAKNGPMEPAQAPSQTAAAGGTTEVPEFAEGGHIDSTGLAIVHAGELVMPDGTVASGSATATIPPAAQATAAIPIDIEQVAGTALLPAGTTSGLPVTPTGAPPPLGNSTPRGDYVELSPEEKARQATAEIPPAQATAAIPPRESGMPGPGTSPTGYAGIAGLPGTPSGPAPAAPPAAADKAAAASQENAQATQENTQALKDATQAAQGAKTSTAPTGTPAPAGTAASSAQSGSGGDIFGTLLGLLPIASSIGALLTSRNRNSSAATGILSGVAGVSALLNLFKKGGPLGSLFGGSSGKSGDSSTDSSDTGTGTGGGGLGGLFGGLTGIFGGARGAIVPSAAGGLQVEEKSLPRDITAGIRALAADGQAGQFASGRLVPTAAQGMAVRDGKGGQMAVVHPGELILPARETSLVLGSLRNRRMSAAAGAIVSADDGDITDIGAFVMPDGTTLELNADSYKPEPDTGLFAQPIGATAGTPWMPPNPAAGGGGLGQLLTLLRARFPGFAEGGVVPSAAAGMLQLGTTTTSGGITTETQGFLRPTTQPLYPPTPKWLQILLALMGGVAGLAVLSKLFGKKGAGAGSGLSPTEAAQQSDAEGMADQLGGVGTFGGGSLGDLGGIGGDIPQLDSGGNILETGLAVVHAGETVVPSADAGDLIGDSGGGLLGGGSGGSGGGLTGLLSGGQSLLSSFSKLTGVLGSTNPAVGQLGASSQNASSGLSVLQSALKLAGSLMGGGGGGAGGGIGSIFGLIGGLFALEGGGVIPSAAGGMKVDDGKGGTLAIVHPEEMVLPKPISRGLQSLISQGTAQQPQGNASLGQLLGLVKNVPHFADGAWEIDRNMVGMLHAGEQIIPSSYAEGLRMAGGGGPPAAGPSVSYGDTHVHLSAIDSRSGAQFLMAHSDTIAKSFFRAHRNGSRFTPGS